MSKHFNTNLRYLREKYGFEQLELAEMIGKKSASAVSEWEKGLRIPDVGTLSDLSNIFNVTIDDFMNVNLEHYSLGASKHIPLLGTIAAGQPILAEENIEKYFRIDSSIKADFALRIQGDSMIGAHIFNNDIVFIRKQETLENGEIGAVLIEGDATLKKFYREDGTIILQAENSNYRPIILTGGDVRVLGKMVAVLSIRE